MLLVALANAAFAQGHLALRHRFPAWGSSETRSIVGRPPTMDGVGALIFLGFREEASRHSTNSMLTGYNRVDE
jgi:hypothetical protein